MGFGYAEVVTPTGLATSGTPTDAELARLLEDLTVPLSGGVGAS